VRRPIAGRDARTLALFGLVFLLALAVRLVYVLNVPPEVLLANDAGYYDYFARSIASGNGYVMPEGHPTAFWPVGYPAFLAGVYLLFGESLKAAQLVNALLDAGTAVLVMAIARRWWSIELSALAGGIYALFPGAIGFTALTLSEPLFTFLLTASLALVVYSDRFQRGWLMPALAFGLLAALATYVRGLALLLPLLAAFWLLIHGYRTDAALRFGLTAMAVVVLLSLPWAVRNTVRLGELTYLSTNLGQDLRTGHNPNATGGLDFQEQIGWAIQFVDLPPLEAELAKNREGVREAVRYALNNPRHELELSVRKVARLYGDDADSLRWAEHFGVHPVFGDATRSWLFALFNGYYYLVAAASIVGLGLGLKKREPWATLGLALLAYWTLVHIAFFAEPRFHAPLLPVLALLAVGTLASGKEPT
jgi:4-amino-4-deoxy-L-arabinose transferase-like glycosyltransferase